ncbi:MAG: hypothetical protein M3362_01860 [Acidobacteriota bacterium]|nr:hypothetical protein [Acidobacteriota bacterium]
MRQTRLNVVMFALCLAGCASSRPAIVGPATPQATPAPQQPAPETRVVVKEGGWRIPALEGSKALKRTEIKNADAAAPKMYLTEYAPGAPKGGEYVIERSFFSENERRALRLLPYDLAVINLWGYDVEGRKYCYMLRVHPPRIGADQTIRFCDRDGDGTYEAAEGVKYISPPEPPSWARRADKAL